MPKHDVVLVVWADAHSGAGSWAELDVDDKSEFLNESVGLLVTEEQGGKPNHVTLAQSVSQEGDYDHVLYIVNSMVRHISYLDKSQAEKGR